MGYQNNNQGFFKPRHPEKYVGDVNSIRFMSSWELQMDKFLDDNPNVLRWSSEEIAIPYVKPTDGKVHKYYPDYWVEYRNKHGDIIQEIWEVKPETQTKQPKRRGKNKKTQVRESITYAVNVAKWQAATQFCNKYKMKFRIITENQIFK